MSIFSFHLAKVGVATSLQALIAPPNSRNTSGLVHAECLIPMTLGQAVAFPGRYHPTQLALFAAWKDESSLEKFLSSSTLGQKLVSGWHVRMQFYRRWGVISELAGIQPAKIDVDAQQPVVAVTLARLKVLQAPRFIRWGKPVERQVRDDPDATLSLAAFRPLGTLSTFSIWRTEKAMLDMVRGRSRKPLASQHADAMRERNRKDFHHEFTTLRFKPLSEHGKWLNQTIYCLSRQPGLIAAVVIRRFPGLPRYLATVI